MNLRKINNNSLLFTAKALALLACFITDALQCSLASSVNFDSDSYAFHEVQAGQVVTHVFTFTNVSVVPTYIDKVIPGCGCTTVSNTTQAIKPGDTGQVIVRFNSYNYSGSVEKLVLVSFSGLQTNVLRLTGTIHKPVIVSPPYLILNLSSNQQATGSVQIHNAQTIPLVITAVKSGNPALSVVLTTNKPNSDYSVLVTASPPFSQGYQSLVRLFTTQTNFPDVTFLVLCQTTAK